MDAKIEQLRQYFEEKGVTQDKIASMMNVDKAYVNKLLTGKKAFGKKTARTWSDLFGLSYTWLLTGEGDMVSDANDTSKSVPYYIYQELMGKYEAALRENESLKLKIEKFSVE